MVSVACFTLRQICRVERPLVRTRGEQIGVQCMAGTADLGDGLHAGRGCAVVAMATVAGRRAKVLLPEKGDAVNARGILRILIRRDPVAAHMHGIAVARGACPGEVCRVHSRPDILCLEDPMASMAARTLGNAAVPRRIPDPVDTRPVLLELINRQTRIILAHVLCIVVAGRAGRNDVQGMHGGGGIADCENPVCTVTRRALDDPLLSVQGETSVHALLESGKLARGDIRVEARHPDGIRMAPGAHHGDLIGLRFSNEPGRFAHRLFHVVGRRVPPVAAGTCDSPSGVHVMREERGRFVAESLVTGQAAVPRIRAGKRGGGNENPQECRSRDEDLFHKNHPSIVKTSM